MMANNIREVLEGSALEQGWNTDSQLAVVMDFLEYAERTVDPSIRGWFQAFLDERVDAENDPADDGPGEDDPDEDVTHIRE